MHMVAQVMTTFVYIITTSIHICVTVLLYFILQVPVLDFICRKNIVEEIWRIFDQLEIKIESGHQEQNDV